VQGTQVWQFTIRDGGASSPDGDAVATIVNTIIFHKPQEMLLEIGQPQYKQSICLME
ncbi:MAG: hypothetical protein IPG89_21030, partial [Bacteroidetes bacterium]|nr:hypothetical protein [Bacteroidota bacterium]